MDGNWVGSCLSDNVYDIIYNYKNNGRFSPYMSISINKNEREILIFTDEGRMIRPLWNAKNFPTMEDLTTKSIETLIQERKIIIIDSYEIENNVVAMTPQELKKHDFYTLCEIHPSLMVGLCVGLIPYSDHTQAPRITYHASMGKQAIGVYASTNNIRSDTIVHVLHYPEKPLVQTHMGKVSGCDEMVFGMNLIVAVAMYTGFNQEDSVILNQSALDRGLFRSFAFRTIHVEERKKSTTHTEDIMLPQMEIRAKSYNYSKLNSNGIVKAGIFVGPSDVIVGRVQTKNIKTGGEEKIDTSVCIKSGEEGYVDKVFISTSPEGYKMVKVKIRSLKVPEIGDKVASRAAQKGTVGMIFRQEDMPFCCESGIVPDIIINPLCLPSRMTINQIIECIASKSSAQEGIYRYGTPFTRHSTDVVETLCDDLVKNGFSNDGKENMCNGFTGEKFEARIFMGPTYYHRLKHLVSAKIHARNHGSLQALTRQPVEGRSRDGGLRFGEMERDAVNGETVVSLTCGLGIKIKQMYHNGWSVLGFDENKNGMVVSRQTEFLDKGERDCYEIILEDGRKLYPSCRHPFLTVDNKWVRANELVENQTILKTSLEFPAMDIDEEIKTCNGWSILDGKYKTDTISNYWKTLIFARIIGLLTTDGHFHQSSKYTYCASVFLGHLLDVESVYKDIQCLYPDVEFVNKMNTNTYVINLPKDLTFDFIQLEGITLGNKTNQPLEFPSFILDPSCPLPIIREFLGGMFGGDGHTCNLGLHRGKRDLMTSISLSRSTRYPLMNHLKKFFEDFKVILEKFGISKVTIQKAKETTSSKKTTHLSEDSRTYSMLLHLDIDELLPFSEKIGFRYCFHKSQRLQAAVIYYRFRQNVKRQHNWLVNRVDELTNFSKIKKENPTKIVATKKAILQALVDLKKIEPLFHEYAIPSTHDISDHLLHGTTFGKFRSKNFPTAEQYMEKIGIIDWFVDQEDTSKPSIKINYGTKRELQCLETINLKILSINLSTG